MLLVARCFLKRKLFFSLYCMRCRNCYCQSRAVKREKKSEFHAIIFQTGDCVAHRGALALAAALRPSEFLL